MEATCGKSSLLLSAGNRSRRRPAVFRTVASASSFVPNQGVSISSATTARRPLTTKCQPGGNTALTDAVTDPSGTTPT